MKTARTVCATQCLISNINIVDVVEFYGRLCSLFYWKYTSQSWRLFVPCQETQVAAVRIPFVKKLQTKLQETYYTILKYKNEITFVPSFVFRRLFFRPRCFRKEA